MGGFRARLILGFSIAVVVSAAEDAGGRRVFDVFKKAVVNAVCAEGGSQHGEFDAGVSHLVPIDASLPGGNATAPAGCAL